MNQGGMMWLGDGPWLPVSLNSFEIKYSDGTRRIVKRAPSRLADFHALDKSAQRVILEIEVGLRDD